MSPLKHPHPDLPRAVTQLLNALLTDAVPPLGAHVNAVLAVLELLSPPGYALNAATLRDQLALWLHQHRWTSTPPIAGYHYWQKRGSNILLPCLCTTPEAASVVLAAFAPIAVVESTSPIHILIDSIHAD